MPRLLLLVAVVALSACASKNPLMTEPGAAPAAKKAEAPAAPPPAAAPAAAKPTTADKALPAAKTGETAQPQTPSPTQPTVTKPAAAPATSAASAVPVTERPSLTKRWLGIFSPYKIDIQQGNFISHEMAAQVKEGLTKEQVRFLLGVPLLTDMFHAGRWDYLFRLQKANGPVTANRLTIFFKDNRVTHFESTQLPDEAAYISHISGTPPAPPKEAKKPAPETKPVTK